MMSLHRNVILDPALVNVIEVSAECLCRLSDGTNKRVVNVWHFYAGIGLALGSWDPTAVAASFKETYQDSIMSGIQNSSTLSFVGVRPLNDPTSIMGGNTYSVAGTTGGDRLPLDNAVVINLPSGIRGRSFQGRKHFAPISESFTTADILTGSGSTTWMATRDQIRANLTFNSLATDWQMIVLSSTLSDLGATSPKVTFADVVDASLNLTLGTMRKRKEKTQIAPG